MKRIIILLTISVFLHASVDSFLTEGMVLLPKNNFLISNEYELARNIASEKALRICDGDIEQVSDWKMEQLTKETGGIFGGPTKLSRYIQASAFFICL